MTRGAKSQADVPDQNGTAAHIADPAAIAKAALEVFAKAPFKFALKPVVKRVLQTIASNADPSEQGNVDKAYFRELEALYLLRLLQLSCLSNLESCAFDLQDATAVLTARLQNGAAEPAVKKGTKAKTASRNGNDDAQTYDGECWAFSSRYIKTTQAALDLAMHAIQVHQQQQQRDQKADSKAIAPRFARLMSRLDLSEKEQLAMMFVLVKQVSQEDFSNLFPKFGRSSPSFAVFADLDTLEILQFLKPTRQHIKEGLVPDCSKALLGGGQAFDEMAFSLRSQGLNETSLHFSPEVVKALLGEPLTEEDLLKVDKTQLMDVLKEEPSFSHDHFNDVKAASEGQAEPPKAPADSGLGANEDVFELIKQEVQRDVVGKKRQAAGESAEPPASKRGKLATADEAVAAANATLAATDPSISPDTAAADHKSPASKASQDASDRMQTEEEERDAERRQSNSAAAARPSGDGKEADGTMREYRNDLEYLEDSFKLMIILLRIGKFRRILALEEADQEGFEEEGLYYHQRKRGDPKSRAQQQLRELEGKERLERSRVERRLKMTQAIRWPTLEA